MTLAIVMLTVQMLVCPTFCCVHVFRARERVIVIGAGIAGLAAARELSDVANVVVLEAQDRLGGRVHTNHSLGAPVELGAVWIHRAEGNVVLDLARSFGCPTFTSENKQLAIYSLNGSRISPRIVQRMYSHFSRVIMPRFLRRRAQLRGGRGAGDDMDMRSLLAALPEFASVPRSYRCVIDFLLFRDVVQDHTADLRQTSAACYDTDQYGGRGKDVVFPRGYDCIVRGLSRHLDVRTGVAGEVSALRWGSEGVVATLADGRVERADRAIVTTPLGVLKASLGAAPQPRGALRFEPPLPPEMRVAINRLGYGESLKVALRFPRAFWPPDAHFIGKVGGHCDAYGSARHMEFLNVARYAAGGTPVLLMETETGWARELSAMDDAQLVDTVYAELRRAFPSAPRPDGHVIARMGANPFQRGGFSYMAPGGSHELHRQLAAPLAGGRLLLAGEHTSAMHAGTVHGALISGRRAAAHARAALYRVDAARVSAAGEEYEAAYAERLWHTNYDGQPESEEGEDTWDRNP